MPSLNIAITYGDQTFAAGTAFTNSVISVVQNSNGTPIIPPFNVPANATSWTVSVPASPVGDPYHVTCQAMSNATPIGTPVSHNYTVLADVTLSVPVALG